MQLRSIFMGFAGGVTVMAAASTAWAAESPPPLVGSPYVMERLGVHTQIQDVSINQTDLSRLAEGGFAYVRQGLYWENVEKQKGVYDFTEFDKFVESIRRRGLKALVFVAYGNKLYESVTHMNVGGNEREIANAPASAHSRRAFAAFAAAAAERYRDDPIVWEIWNEPDVNHFWPPANNAKDYVKLAAETCTAMRAQVPQARIIGPALGAGAVPVENRRHTWFAEVVASAPLMNCLSGVSVHPYGFNRDQSSPDSIRARYNLMREMMRAGPAGVVLPIVSSEWGYTVTGPEKDRVREDEQAANFVRMSLVNVAEGAPLSIWYNWKNIGENPASPDSGFGMVTRKGELKPVYRIAQVMRRQLQGYWLEGEAENLPEGLTGYRLRNDEGREKWVIWRDKNEWREVPFNLKGMGIAKVLDMTGKTVADNDVKMVNIGAKPMYVIIKPKDPVR